MPNYTTGYDLPTKQRRRSSLPPARTWGDVASRFIDSFADRLEQKMEERRTDERANKMLATLDAPRATFVSEGDPTAPRLTAEQVAQHNATVVDPATGAHVATTYRTPELGGEKALEFQQKQEQTDLRRQQLLEQVRRDTHAGRSRVDANLIDTPYGKMTPRQWVVTQRENATARATTEKNDQARDAMEAEFRNTAGVALDDVDYITNQRLVDESGAPSKTGKYFAADLPRDDGTSVSIRMPKGQAESLLEHYDDFQKRQLKQKPVVDLQSANPTASTIPKVATPEEARKLPSGTKFYDANGILRVVP